jgi:hypothetical protein
VTEFEWLERPNGGALLPGRGMVLPGPTFIALAEGRSLGAFRNLQDAQRAIENALRSRAVE